MLWLSVGPLPSLSDKTEYTGEMLQRYEGTIKLCKKMKKKQRTKNTVYPLKTGRPLRICRD